MEYFIKAIKNYADFSGRARRKEYWMYVLFFFIFYIPLSLIDKAVGSEVFTLIYSLILFIPSLSLATRRLHDTGKSGWWQLIILVPLIGAIVLLVFYVQDSHDDNDYGQNPKMA